MKLLGKLAVLAGTGLLFGMGTGGIPTAQADTRISIGVGIAPPPPRWEPVPAPRVGFFWAPGYWIWVEGGYRWHTGRWHRYRPGYTYVHPSWYRSGGSWRFHSGHWRPSHYRVIAPGHHRQPPGHGHWRSHGHPSHGHHRGRHRGHR